MSLLTVHLIGTKLAVKTAAPARIYNRVNGAAGTVEVLARANEKIEEELLF